MVYRVCGMFCCCSVLHYVHCSVSQLVLINLAFAPCWALHCSLGQRQRTGNGVCDPDRARRGENTELEGEAGPKLPLHHHTTAPTHDNNIIQVSAVRLPPATLSLSSQLSKCCVRLNAAAAIQPPRLTSHPTSPILPRSRSSHQQHCASVTPLTPTNT